MYPHRGSCAGRHTCFCGHLKIQYVLLVFILLDVAFNIYLGSRAIALLPDKDNKTTTASPSATGPSGARADARTASDSVANKAQTLAALAAVTIAAIPSLFSLFAYLLALVGICCKRSWTVVPLMVLKAMVILMALYFATAFTIVHFMATDTMSDLTENLEKQQHVFATSATKNKQNEQLQRGSETVRKVLRAVMRMMNEFYTDTMMVVLPIALFAVIIFTLTLRTYRYYSERDHYGECGDISLIDQMELDRM